MTTKERCIQLYEEGVKVAEIVKRVGIRESTVYKHLALSAYSTAQGPPLNRVAWLEWLEGMTKSVRVNHGTFSVRINGFQLSDADQRVLFYWRQGASRPVTLTRADRFCGSIDVPLQHFFLWCYFESNEPWEERPEWEVPLEDIYEVPERFGEVLKRHLERETPFDDAWKAALVIAKPDESWNQAVAGASTRESSALAFSRRAFKEEYEDALARRKERTQAA